MYYKKIYNGRQLADTIKRPKTAAAMRAVATVTLATCCQFSEVDSSVVAVCRLTAAVQVTCNGDYHGPLCDRYCVARDNCTGHYTCNQASGAAECLPGWTGDNCTVSATNASRCPTLSPYQPPLTGKFHLQEILTRLSKVS